MAAASILTTSMDGGGLNASGTGGVEMAKALTSMQLRNEQFRQLYEQLKQEYATLSDAYADCQRTLEKATEENRQMQEKFKNLLDKLQMENRKKTAQIEEMKTQVCFLLFPSSFFLYIVSQSYLVT
jgi:xanthine dehydrogenase iron-sulfur cluster and FAD-binding subunit A